MLKENKYNMSKVILISGSNGSGNTEWILNRLNEQIEDSGLLVRLLDAMLPELPAPAKKKK